MALSRSDAALGAFYRCPCARMDKPRANTAVAHKFARMLYFTLTRGEAFVELGSSATKNSIASATSKRSGAALARLASRSPQPATP